METEAPPGVGSLLVLRMRLPEMIVGWRAPEWRIAAHVVHVEPAGDLGTFGVGVQFHYYEPMSQQHGRTLLEYGAPGEPGATSAHVAAVSRTGVRA